MNKKGEGHDFSGVRPLGGGGEGGAGTQVEVLGLGKYNNFVPNISNLFYAIFKPL